MFGDMMRSIERMQQEMSKLISTNKRAALNNAEGHMERLTHEIADPERFRPLSTAVCFRSTLRRLSFKS